MSKALTPERQLEEWRKGNSLCPNTRDECCPDFSCCKPELLAPQEVRDAYCTGTRDQQLKLLGSFLGGLVGTMDEDVYIAGADADIAGLKEKLEQ
jgi:hypothetical protein